MQSNVNYSPARRDIPPVSVYMEESFRQDGISRLTETGWKYPSKTGRHKSLMYMQS